MSEVELNARVLAGGRIVRGQVPAIDIPRLRDLLIGDLIDDAPIIEIYHHAPKRAYAHGETETDLLNEMAMIADPIGVARRLPPGRYRVVPVEAP